jgi:hypothetical protein
MSGSASLISLINYFYIPPSCLADDSFPPLPSCVADNSLGRTKKYIEVSGRPGPTEFLSSQYSNHLDRYNLTFKIESLPELDEIKLLYRKLMVMHGFQSSHLSSRQHRLLMDFSLSPSIACRLSCSPFLSISLPHDNPDE